MGDKGRLIVSTKTSAAQNALAGVVASAAMFILALIWFSVDGIEEDCARLVLKIFGSFKMTGLLYYGFGLFAIFEGIYLFAINYKRNQSYCEVYEEGVVGVTGKNYRLRDINESPQGFDLAYEDIINVTDSGKTFCIYTAYGSFEVVKKGRKAEQEQMLREIRDRMAGKAAPAAPKAAPEKPAPVAAPTRAPVDDGRVKCPQCGTMQSRERDVCYMCGTPLGKD